MASAQAWHALPECVLVDVFKLLPLVDRRNASLACKHWLHCFNHPKLWSEYTFDCAYKMNIKWESYFIRKFGKSVKSVTIFAGDDSRSVKRMLSLLNSLTQKKNKTLEKFSIKNNGHYPTDAEQKKITVHLSKLLSPTTMGQWEFNLTCIDLNSSEVLINDKLVTILANHHNNLKVVKIQQDANKRWPVRNRRVNFSVRSMLILVQNCKSLQELHTHYQCVNTSVIEALSEKRHAPFKFLSLCYYSHSAKEDVIESHSWKRLTEANPNVEVTLEDYSGEDDVNTFSKVLCPGIPLVSLRLPRPSTAVVTKMCRNAYGNLRWLRIDDGIDSDEGFDTALLNLVSCSEKMKELHCYFPLSRDIIDQIVTVRDLEKSTLECFDDMLDSDYSDFYDYGDDYYDYSDDSDFDNFWDFDDDNSDFSDYDLGYDMFL